MNPFLQALKQMYMLQNVGGSTLGYLFITIVYCQDYFLRALADSHIGPHIGPW
jgi:hypothetical protein